ncbi:MAG: RDD family protein [Acidimicrobiales bacterium]
MTYFESESDEEVKQAGTPARYGLRVKAALIDFVIGMAAVAVPAIGLIFAIVSIAERDNNTITSGEGWAIFFSALGLLFWLLWQGWFFGYRQGKSGTTPGKRAAGIRLVSIKTGEVPGGGTGVGRLMLPHLINSFVGVYWVIDLLWPLWDDENQRLTDKIVSTQVVLEGKGLDTPVLS